MAPATPALAEARSDRADQLIAAAEPLVGLQLRCGGTLPGPIAIPELAELVGRARVLRLKLGRPITAQDGHETVRAWVEVEPELDAEGQATGCRILVRHWQAAALPAEDSEALISRRAEIDRALAELTARLDARQAVLAVEADVPDLAGVAAAMRAALGRPWTDFVTIAGDIHHQPLHWRLLDGAELTVAGSARRWRARLIPHGLAGAEPNGFELCLTSDEPPPLPAPATGAVPELGERLVGRDLAPVLRQPIARIIANAETIRAKMAGPLAEEYAAYARDIATAGEHLLSLVDDLADLEVIESDDFATAPDPVDLADVARRAAGILGVRAREKRIVIAAPAEAETLPAVAEFRRVLQILLNLVGNAIRYAPEETRITVSLERKGDLARIAVADQGPGLDAEQAARVFDKFERLGRSGDGGSGLGLYISRRLARAMGGDLVVESHAGEGARFVLSVPAG
ncbi:MAG: HAMP domain-containing histidine kinase [Proteobacteria bacterium]|nr:HAMP domain-containing histidine kinase [Pseudomonadota bacterium]